jgi:hypothetical protein
MFFDGSRDWVKASSMKGESANLTPELRRSHPYCGDSSQRGRPKMDPPGDDVN